MLNIKIVKARSGPKYNYLFFSESTGWGKGFYDLFLIITPPIILCETANHPI